MLSIYWVALGFGGIFVVLTTLMGADSDSDGDSDFDGGADFDGDADFNGDIGDDVGHIDGGADMHGPGVLDILFLMFSIRFWSFFTAFFGLTGVGLSYINGVGIITLAVAIGMGLVAGYGVSYLFKIMSRANTSTDVGYGDMIGQIGEVLLPVSEESRGKVRLTIKGHTLDMSAKCDSGSFDIGDKVTVVSVTQNSLIVSTVRK
jgi:membrane protein implicated in regulation of membrane protease activity